MADQSNIPLSHTRIDRNVDIRTAPSLPAKRKDDVENAGASWHLAGLAVTAMRWVKRREDRRRDMLCELRRVMAGDAT